MRPPPLQPRQTTRSGQRYQILSQALRQALRQDPDVIVVSELRDLETIRIAPTAAETGHLVIATLHTMNAPQSIDRLVDVFPPDQQQQIVAQLANVCEAIISQRLIPQADGQGRVLASEVLRMNHGLRTCIRERKIEQSAYCNPWPKPDSSNETPTKKC